MSKELLKKLKEEHGEIWTLQVGDATAFVKKPSRRILKMAAKLGKDDPYRFNEVLVKNCVVGGDQEKMLQDDYIDDAAAQISELIPQKAASIKKC